MAKTVMSVRSATKAPDKAPNLPPADKPATATATGDDRMTIPIKDGKIDWTRVRGSREPRLRQLLSESGIVAGAPSSAAPDTVSPAINAALVSTLYDLLAQLEAIAAVRMYGCTIDQALSVLAFSETEKTALSDPTVAVLNKYLSQSVLDKYGAEVMLALMLASMTRQKFGALGARVERQNAARPGATRDTSRTVEIVKGESVKSS